jgi:hypothetical protein
LDIVLEENPNPLGMVTRVFRHLCLKDARRVTAKAARFLASATTRFHFQEIRDEELRSYGVSAIEPRIYRLFEKLVEVDGPDVETRFGIAAAALKRELELFGT